ncbi:hypothetical protein GCM10010964_18810 [Caldovatus sediminis]|uniref:Putative tail fiber protein gp53-like C-terminal domain-containing protein n=1 Tax=Caldovatus sediminis TaxID=2041189 RepID=A0A8J3EAV6_9PROT|nr:hypothetical protein [Caldovatus sediminis]GGG31107.1 hypothetical protein GCM10010964_18810 [Caldovatus sediminis]
MDRINGANTVDIGGGRRGFRDRNLLAGLSGTQVTAAFLNGLQEEVLGVIEGAGLTPNEANWGQLLAAIQGLVAAGAASAVAAALNTPQLLTAAGYKVFPGGLILQWASTAVPDWGAGTGEAAGTLAWPIVFPAACLAAFVSLQDDAASEGKSVARVTTKTASGITWRLQEWADSINPTTLWALGIGV